MPVKKTPRRRKKKTPQRRKKKVVSRLVEPLGPKTGCFYCPLLIWSKDFDSDLRPKYERPPQTVEKMFANEPDGHTVHNRCLQEDYGEVDVLFVGEAPNRIDDKRDELFTGVRGSILRSIIDDVDGISQKKSGFTHLVRCNTPRNKNINKTEMKCCTPQLLREIRARKPKVIVAFGGKALEFFTGDTGIMAFHGSVLECHLDGFEHIPIVASFSPAYVAQMDYMLDSFYDAMVTVGSVVDGTYEPKMGEGEYRVLEDADSVEAYLEELQSVNAVTAFDTETGSLHTFHTENPQLLCFSFSNKEGEGVTIPFDHIDSPFADWRGGVDGDRELVGERVRERNRVVAALRAFFESDVPKIAQHEKFDRKHIYEALGVFPNNVVRDTMLTHYVLDERPGTHGLKSLAHKYTGMGGYEKPLEDYIAKHPEANPKNGGSYANIPGEFLFRYASMDADVTVRVDNGLCNEPEYLDDAKLRAMSEHLYPRLNHPLAMMEYHGAHIDTSVVEFLDNKYSTELRQMQSEILDFPEVRQFIADQSKSAKNGFELNLRSVKQLRLLLFEYSGLRPTRLTDTGFSRMVHRYEQRVREAKEKNKPEPKFENIVKQAIHKKEWSLFTTDATALQEYVAQGSELAQKIIEYRGVATLHSTFIVPLRDLLDENDCVHGSFVPARTSTGRLACVHADTLVRTQVGDVPISKIDLCCGNITQVLTHNGRWAQVLRVFVKGRDRMYRVWTNDGRTIQCTAEHLFYAPGGWRTLGQLKVGATIYTQTTAETTTPATLYPIGSEVSVADSVGRGKSYRAGGREYRATTIRSIEDIGVHDVWDLEVEGDQAYYAQGFLNHNSREPNLQNIPNKGDALVKRCYTSRFGDEGVLLQLDYSQVELRVAAAWFQDEGMQQAYIEGADLHRLTAIAISGLDPHVYDTIDSILQKDWRTRAKRVNFLTLYAGGANTLQATLKKDGIELALDACQEMLDKFFEVRWQLKNGIEKLKKDTKKKGYLTAFSGRKRRVPAVFSSDMSLQNRALRQSINFPIQCGASEFTLMTLILAQEYLEETNKRSILSLSTHDSSVFDCHVDEVFEIAYDVKHIMETIPERSERIWPGIDWSWLTVPILADAEIGVDWGQMVGFDPNDYDVDDVWARMAAKMDEKPLEMYAPKVG